MAAESPKRKMLYAIQAFCWTLFFTICGGIYLARTVNSSKIDTEYCGTLASQDTTISDACDSINDKYYDVMFYAGPFSDEDEMA